MKKLIIAIVAALAAGCAREIAQEEEFVPENVALGKTYVFSEAPNYPICTDKGDTKQLTDGSYCQRSNPEGGFYFWTQKGTVGWKKLRKPVEITIDLGEVKPISGASLRTAGGKESVLWPGALEIFVSDDNNKYFYVADLVETKRYSFPIPEDVYGIYNYRNNSLKTKGRYVKFRCFPAGNYFFCDELEVYSGPAEYLNIKEPGREVKGEFLEKILITRGMKNRMFSDIIAIEKMDIRLKEKLGPKYPGGIKEKLQLLWNEVSKYDFRSEPGSMTAVVPMNGLHERIIAMNSEILNLKGFNGLILRHKDRYERVSLFEEPTEDPPSVTVRLMNGEYRADTINICNCTPERRELHFSVKGLPDPAVLKVYKVCGVDTREKIVDFSALVELKDVNGVYDVSAPAGMTTQLWFSFNPVSVKPGNYAGEINFSSREWTEKVPLSLTVSPLKFPDKTGLNVILWDYLLPPLYSITEKNAAEAVKILKSHFVNIATASPEVAGFPTEKDVDQRGDIVKPLDFSAFDKWVALRPGAAVYHIELGRISGTPFAGTQPGTERFDRAVSQWTREITAHAAAKGIKSSRLQFNIIEPSTAEDYKFLAQWAKAVKSVSSGVLLFCTPGRMDRTSYMEYAHEALDYMNVICVKPVEYDLEIPKDVKNYFERRRKDGTDIWFYMYSEGVRHFDPAYFRLLPYRTFVAGASGAGFWSFADIGSATTSWNPYLMPSGYNYSPVYISPDSITTAKQFEAIREGIEDYYYLLTLKASGEEDYSLNLATSVLTRAVRKGGNDYWKTWQNNYSACTAGEKMRFEILNRLEKKLQK